MEIKTISAEEMQKVRTKGVWDTKKISEHAKTIIEQLENIKEGQALAIDLESFYTEIYTNDKRIKYIGYYCRKHLQEALNELIENATVKTYKGNLLISGMINR